MIATHDIPHGGSIDLAAFPPSLAEMSLVYDAIDQPGHDRVQAAVAVTQSWERFEVLYSIATFMRAAVAS